MSKVDMSPSKNFMSRFNSVKDKGSKKKKMKMKSNKKSIFGKRMNDNDGDE